MQPDPHSVSMRSLIHVRSMLWVFQESSAPGLLLADMHCLPGMEGGPVLSSSGKLIGVLSLPLSSPSFSAEA